MCYSLFVFLVRQMCAVLCGTMHQRSNTRCVVWYMLCCVIHYEVQLITHCAVRLCGVSSRALYYRMQCVTHGVVHGV